MSEAQGGGLAWIGRHAYDGPDNTLPGMRGSINLTAVRGTTAHDFLTRMGADPGLLARAVPFREIGERWADDDYKDWECMFAQVGEWTVILESSQCATWYLNWIEEVGEAIPREGEELVCVTLNKHQAPPRLLYSPRNGEVWNREFGQDFIDAYRPDDPTGRVAAFDAALRDIGVAGDDHLAPRVYAVVGEHLGIDVPHRDVEEGLLPSAALPDPT
ncbi:hypothetical protein [Streptomyces violascens]|uniref:hypothetical protein n=1 Tax=Streptomyces violascens TaxID=67381 RepID=UPI001CFD1B39|nr:hypothetical protein [Streptomyces violascens]